MWALKYTHLKMLLYFIIHNSYMFRPYVLAMFRALQVCSKCAANLYIPEHGQDIWPKHVGVVYKIYKNIVQLADGEMFIY